MLTLVGGRVGSSICTLFTATSVVGLASHEYRIVLHETLLSLALGARCLFELR